MKKILALSIFVMIAAVAGVLLLSYRQHDIISIVFNSPSAVIVHTEVVKPLKHHPQGKPIIDGGIHNMTDLYNAMHDPAVADNFKNFDFSSAHLIILDHSVLAYVSFRVDGKGVFWTVSPVLLQHGESIWTDDQGNYLRSRCGNRIAFAPGNRVLPLEEQPDSTLIMPVSEHIVPIAPVQPAPHVYITVPPITPVPPYFPPLHPTSGADNPMPTVLTSAIGIGLLGLFRSFLKKRELYRGLL